MMLFFHHSMASGAREDRVLKPAILAQQCTQNRAEKSSTFTTKLLTDFSPQLTCFSDVIKSLNESTRLLLQGVS